MIWSSPGHKGIMGVGRAAAAVAVLLLVVAIPTRLYRLRLNVYVVICTKMY